MKQKASDNDILTKQEFFAAITDLRREMVTRKDLATSFKEFREIIREDLHKDIRKEIIASEARTAIKLAELELRIDDKAQRYRNEVLTRFDEWAGELENARQDRTLSTKHILELRDGIDNHEKRIVKLEKTQQHS